LEQGGTMPLLPQYPLLLAFFDIILGCDADFDSPLAVT